MLSNINLRELMPHDSTAAERLAMYVRGAAIVAAIRNKSCIVVSTQGFTSDDVQNAYTMLRESGQFTEVYSRVYPTDLMEVCW